MPATLREMIGPYMPFALTGFVQQNMADASGVMEFINADNTETPPMPFAGSVVGISVMTNADLTGGTIVFTVGVDTVSDASLSATLDDTHQAAYSWCAPGLVPFAANAKLSVIYTKSGTVAPTTTDAAVILWVVMNPAQN